MVIHSGDGETVATQERYESAMRLALVEARAALADGEWPYGAVVIAADGTPVATGRDRVATTGDPTRHGEFDVVRAAIAVRGGDLAGCILVSTVEPCAMCSGAAWYAGIATSVFGLAMRELQSLCPAALEEPFGPVAELYRPMARRLDAVPGILRANCLALFLDSSADRMRS